MIILLPSDFSIITLSASISSWFMPSCFIIACIFLGSSPPIPGNIFLLRNQIIYSFLKNNIYKIHPTVYIMIYGSGGIIIKDNSVLLVKRRNTETFTDM